MLSLLRAKTWTPLQLTEPPAGFRLCSEGLCVRGSGWMLEPPLDVGKIPDSSSEAKK